MLSLLGEPKLVLRISILKDSWFTLKGLVCLKWISSLRCIVWPHLKAKVFRWTPLKTGSLSHLHTWGQSWCQVGLLDCCLVNYKNCRNSEGWRGFQALLTIQQELCLAVYWGLFWETQWDLETGLQVNWCSVSWNAGFLLHCLKGTFAGEV